MDFFFKLGVAMYLTQICPSMEPNKSAIQTQAASAGIDIKNGISDQKHPQAFREMLRAQAFVTIMNDAGGPFPCDKILTIVTSQDSPPQEWQEFVQAKK
jgi:hypothetical protein